MELLEVAGLPELPSAAARAFHSDWLPRAQALLAKGDLLIAFAAADHTHSGWRLAAIQTLAREHAPARANAISGGSAATIAAARTYLSDAHGITGQYLPLDDAGAGPVVQSAA